MGVHGAGVYGVGVRVMGGRDWLTHVEPMVNEGCVAVGRTAITLVIVYDKRLARKRTSDCSFER